MTDVSLAKLIVALYVPGFLLMLMYMIQIYIQCTINPALGPGAARGFTWKEKLAGSAGLASVTIVFILTLGGIQFGSLHPMRRLPWPRCSSSSTPSGEGP